MTNEMRVPTNIEALEAEIARDNRDWEGLHQKLADQHDTIERLQRELADVTLERDAGRLRIEAAEAALFTARAAGAEEMREAVAKFFEAKAADLRSAAKLGNFSVEMVANVMAEDAEQAAVHTRTLPLPAPSPVPAVAPISERVDRMLQAAMSACFHYWDCLGECDKMRPAMARLADACGYLSNPATDAEIREALALLPTPAGE